MRRRILVTITDTRRFRQFTLHQIVRWIVAAGVVAGIVLGVGTWLYLQRLQEAKEAAQTRQKELEAQIEALKEQEMRLGRQITQKSAALAQLGDRLSALEVMVGRKVDENFTVPMRLRNVTLSAAQLALIFTVVPNGAPLPFQGVTSPFGRRIHPVTGRTEFHTGIDLRAKHHKPVWTTADGIVEYAGYNGGSGYGNLVIVDHGFGFKTYYGHLHKVLVRRGDTVVKGDPIGLSGNTGRSTAPHLHYEVRFLGRPLNPYWFMRWRRQDYRAIFQKIKEVPWQSLIALAGHIASRVVPPSSPRKP